MRKFLLLILTAISLIYSTKGISQVTLTATVGTTNGSYTTLGDAFAAINAGTHKGVITITLTGNTTEAATATLDSSGNGNSSYTWISIRPAAATAVTVSGSIVGNPLINLNGADAVNFDGINSGGASLTLFNTDATNASSSTLQLIRDASNNKFLNLTIKGAAPSTTTQLIGTVFLSTSTISGNDKNRFSGCSFDGTASAPILFISNGTSTTSDTQNSEDTISNCRFYDFFNVNVTSSFGLLLNAGSTNWVISGNSFYQTAGRTTGSQGVHTSLTIFPTWTSDTHQVLNNYSGGSAPNGVGSTTYTGSGTNVLGYVGFNVQTGGPGNLVQGNFCQNVSVTYGGSAGSFGNNAFNAFIGGYNGTTTFTQNTVNNFSITNTAGAALGSGMVFNGRVTTAGVVQSPLFTITNNVISNVTFNAGGTGSAQFYGIRLETSSGASLTTTSTISNPYFTVSGNTINNLSSTAGGSVGWVRGIGVVNTNGSGSTCPLFPRPTITNNNINGISCFATGATITSPTAAGIFFPGSGNYANTVDTIEFRENTIYNLTSANTGDVSSVVSGIYASTGLLYIHRNRIYNLINSAAGTTFTPVTSGMNIRAVAGGASVSSNIVNNFISLGSGQNTNTNIFGIFNNFTNTNTLNVYHNSIFIGGTSGTRNSIAFYRGGETMAAGVTSPIDLKNNVFYNTRSGGSGKNYAIGSFGTGTWTSDGNVLVSSGNVSTLAFWNNADNDLATYKTNSTGDAASRSITVNFINTATGDLHVTGASNGDANLIGVNGSGVTVDFDGATRRPWAPYVGADEGSILLSVQMIAFNGTKESRYNKLNWSTSSESNNKGFDVERSIDGKSYSTIAFIASKSDRGYSSSALYYTFNDEKVGAATYYYRLKQIDNDGKTSYSNVVVLKGEKAFNLTALYPNPVKDELNVAITSEKAEKTTINITDMNGKLIKQMVVGLSIGENNVILNVGSLAAGYYTVQVINSNMEIKTQRFIKN